MSGGPYFDELSVGQRFTNAPPMALTDGAAALHQAILGDRLALALDPQLAERVTGEPGVLAHPGLVWDVAIGQSTVATYRVMANLFYRGLAFRRAPRIGDVLHTTTEVIGLRQTSKAGLAALRIRTVDQEDRPVLDFARCAMLPRRTETDHADDLDAIGGELTGLEDSWAGWDLGALPSGELPEVTDTEGADVVSAAPELARLSLNVAMAHHDRTNNPNGARLVYGGHTIGLACAQVSRALPSLAYIVAWHSCDHTAPVFEGDGLRTRVTVERCDGHLAHIRAEVEAERADGERADVLDWRFVGLVP